MTRIIRRPNKRDLFVVGTAAALTFAPQAMAAEGTGVATSVETLRKENARLHSQLAEMKKKLDRIKGGQKSRKNPNSLKQLDSGYANGGSAGKTSAGMTCGANMNMNGAAAGKTQGAGKTSGEMSCGANMMYKMPPGSQFYYNPVFGGTDDMYHTHPEGMWMFNVHWMHSEKDGLQAGRSSVSTADVGPAVLPGSPYPSKYPYMMIPTRMSMDMLMFMGMYGVTDRLTLMGMLNYQGMNMPMLMDMGNMPTMGMPPGPYHQVQGVGPMVTGGLGDTQLYAMYKIYDTELGNVTGTLGLNIPTGDTNQQISMMGYTFRAPYDMQNGSGTFDFKPALTYSWLSGDALWNLGAQVSGTIHMGTNNGWAYGDSYKLSTWGQRAFGDFSTWARATYTDTAPIRGQDANISCLNVSCNPANSMQVSPMPDSDPHNYGGQVLNVFLGAAYQFHAMSIGVEAGMPAYQNLNGLQQKNHWQVTTGMQSMF